VPTEARHAETGSTFGNWPAEAWLPSHNNQLCHSGTLKNTDVSMGVPLLSKDATIIVVGSGTFGLSTAFHLARRGFTNVTCLDRFPYPSPDSAGFDINKIVNLWNDDPIFARMTREALAEWQQPLFEQVWHEVGLITSATSDQEIRACREEYEDWVETGDGPNVEWLESADDFRAFVPQLGAGDGIIPGWKGFLHRRAGWAAAEDALRLVGDEAKKMGVSFVSGPSGTMKELLLDQGDNVIGVVAEDGTRWEGDRIVLSTGAWSDSLVDTEGQLEARCWTLAHVQLAEEECEQFSGIPILMNVEEGFFFEPNKEGRIKFCNEFPGFTYKVTLPSGRSTSRPRSHAQHPGDTIPAKSRGEIRALITKTVPQFKHRPFVEEKVCWCTDTMDRKWLIDVHPQHPRLILATGDSGNAFKMLPVIGKYIGDVVEGRPLDPVIKDTWRWRPDKKERKKRLGGDGETRDLDHVRPQCLRQLKPKPQLVQSARVFSAVFQALKVVQRLEVEDGKTTLAAHLTDDVCCSEFSLGCGPGRKVAGYVLQVLVEQLDGLEAILSRHVEPVSQRVARTGTTQRHGRYRQPARHLELLSQAARELTRGEAAENSLGPPLEISGSEFWVQEFMYTVEHVTT
jgi:sarcosine oxidase / L-pipecolate oxidase